MTENIKKLLELVSGNEELKNRLTNASKDEVIAIAKEHGIALTDADFEAPKGELSDDELGAVSGGKKCTCVLGGGGTASWKQKTCACVGMGVGEREDGSLRCSCPLAGEGKND